MKNWKAMAQAADLPIPPQEMERVSASLDSLEKAFRPLADGLAREEDLALVFDPIVEAA